MKKIPALTLTLLLSLAVTYQSIACTNFIVTKGASKDGSVMLTYSADSHVLYGELYHWPAATWPTGSMLDVYEWDTGKFLARFPRPTSLTMLSEHERTPGSTLVKPPMAGRGGTLRKKVPSSITAA